LCNPPPKSDGHDWKMLLFVVGSFYFEGKLI
jgi:hypothetical protein